VTAPTAANAVRFVNEEENMTKVTGKEIIAMARRSTYYVHDGIQYHIDRCEAAWFHCTNEVTGEHHIRAYQDVAASDDDYFIAQSLMGRSLARLCKQQPAPK
jgi:hypothetical protein